MEKKSNKRENFIRISENRVSKILVLLSQLTNLSNASFYEYEEEDIINVFNIIEEETRRSKEKLIKFKKKRKRFEI